jgi:predicted ester cyclase
MGMPATGKPIRTGSIAIYRLADGKIVEHWGEHDGLGVMMQLGLMPAPGQ